MDLELEKTLVHEVQAGNSKSYQRLLKHHLPPLNRYLVRMTGNDHDAEDLTQEVFLRFWQKSTQFNPEKSKLTTWLHQIAHNLCIDKFRQESKFASDPLQIITKPSSHALDVGQPEQGPQSALWQDKKSAEINGAIQRLPEAQRSALIMCHYQGLSNKQTANILNISVAALESLLSRGRKKLRLHLDENKV